MANACEQGGQETEHMGHKIEEFTRWKRCDNWQKVAVRNRALWKQLMLEFTQFAVGRLQFILTFVPAP